MGIWKRLFDGDASKLRDRANAEFDARDFGSAKLTYEKVLAQIPRNAEEDRRSVEQKIHACLDGIAAARVEEAQRLLNRGDVDLAQVELNGAIEVARSDDLKRQAIALRDNIERDDAVAQALPVDVSDEERLALIAGQWEGRQAEEYEAYGDAFFNALLALHDERFADARQTLEAVLENAPSPRYLYLEVGRARLLDEDIEPGAQALAAFLESLDEGEGSDARLAARLELAELADNAGDTDGALAHYEAAVVELEDDHRPYLAMGNYLRRKQRFADAVEVLEAGLNEMDPVQPDWRIYQELGLALADTERTEDAIAALEQVITTLTTRQIVDFPPAAATRLAELYEASGRLDRAADMYRALSQGSDKEQHATYYREAARLLNELGLSDDAHRMNERAQALVDAETASERSSEPESPKPELSEPSSSVSQGAES